MNLSSDPINTIENLNFKNNTKSISIYLLVVFALITILCCLPIIKIDISSQSRGIVRAKEDNVAISTIVSGKLTAVNIKNNQTVKIGDTLFTITQENLNNQIELNDTLRTTTYTLLNDIKWLLIEKPDSLKSSSMKEDYHKFINQQNELRREISKAQINHVRYKQLFEKQVVSKAEYENYMFELQARQQALTSFNRLQKAQWENQKRELEERLTNLVSTLTNLNVETNNYVFTAPISGTIENVFGLQVGSFVNASQILGAISPTTNLIVENMVSPNDIGLLNIGQEVKFQLDAFNYNQWGMINGKVIEIDKNITMQDNIAFFKVRCNMDTKSIKLKNGYSTTITKGMTLTTRYYITRRSLYDLLFDKVDDWLNPNLIE